MLKVLFRASSVAVLSAIVVSSWAVTSKLCLDPGHGGSDPGASGNGQDEKVNVLNTQLKFKGWLDQDTADGAGGGSWTVIMTRTTDVFISLQGRCDISNNNACNRFMSIHNNAFDTSAHGTETYCYTSGSSTSFDIRDKVHARQLQAWNRTDRGTKTAGFYVLIHTNAPAELAELAFVDNAGDSVYTGSSSWQDVAAKYHLFAIQDHYGIAAYTPNAAQTYIVDNTDSGFSASANWGTSTNVAGYYGTNYKPRATQSISDPASWTANLAAAGNYQIYAWWTAAGDRSATAPYILPGGTVVNKNQQANGGSWQSLGTVNLAAGNQSTLLSCWTTLGFYVIADAVKFVGPI